MATPDRLRPQYWDGDALVMLDQRKLPQREVWLRLGRWEDVAEAIRDMTVRGAPAIGIAGAYGMALAARAGESLGTVRDALAATRPTAVNLVWALDRVAALGDPASVLAEAETIESEDLAMNMAIGEYGAALLPAGARVLTICNTGALATAGHGTALGIVRTAFAQGRLGLVTSCETRPRQQGLRLTAWELMREQIPFRSIVDSAAAVVLARGEIDAVIAGADRVAANGDTANKIGTLALAVLARHYKVPFYIAAPSSTIDYALAEGSTIPIEERESTEVTEIEGLRVAPTGCPVWNPGFDVTPGGLIDAIITEGGVLRPSFKLAATCP